jgi:hypothetical protein
MWDCNVKQQGFIEAFQQMNRRTLQGAANGETTAVK